MRKTLPLILVTAWSLVVMSIYLFMHRFYFYALTSYMEGALAEVVIYTIMHVLGVAALMAGFLWLKHEYPKMKIPLYSLLAIFIVFVIGLVGIRFLWTDISYFGYYTGPDLVAGVDQIKYAQDAVEGDTPFLTNGEFVISPQEKFASAWDQFGPFFETPSFKDVFFHSLAFLGWHFLIILLFFLSFYCVGALIYERAFNKSLKSITDYLSSVALGVVILSLIGFCLAKLSLFIPLTIGVLLATSLIFGIFGPFQSLYKSLSTPVPLKKISTVNVGLIFLIIIVIAWNFIQVNDPIPQSYDDLTYYLNLPNLISASGSYVTGHMMHALSLLQAMMVSLFGSNSALSKAVLWAFSVLASIGLFAFLNKFLKSNFKSLLIVLVFILVPSIAVHSYVQLKSAFALIFFSLVILLCLYSYLEKKSYKYLFLTGVFAGFAASVKLTALLLLPGIFAIILWESLGFFIGAFAYSLALVVFFSGKMMMLPTSVNEPVMFYLSIALATVCLVMVFVKKQFYIQKHWKPLAVLSLAIIIPLTPWLTSNAISAQNLSFNSVLVDYNYTSPTINWDELGINASDCEEYHTGANDVDYDRFVKERPLLLRLLMAPWDVTFDLSVPNPTVNIGYIFIALCPLLLFLKPYKKDKKSRKEFRYFAVLGICFWFLWLIAGGNLIWYAFPGFALLMLWVAGSFDIYWNFAKWSRIFIVSFLAIWIAFGFHFRSNVYFSLMSAYMPYLGGIFSAEEYVESEFPGLVASINTLNEDPNSKIYFTSAGNLFYYLKNNDSRLYMDHFYEDLSCLYKERDPDLLISRLRESGFDYIVLNLPKPDPAFPDQLFVNSEEIVTYFNEKLPLLHQSITFFIYEL